jgi:hypothetical protein
VERDGRAAAWTGLREWKKAADGGLLLGSGGGIFFLYPLLSGYQVQLENRPNIFEGVVVEVAWNEGALLW